MNVFPQILLEKALLLTNSIAEREAGCPERNLYLDTVGVKFPSLGLVVVFHSVVLRYGTGKYI